MGGAVYLSYRLLSGFAGNIISTLTSIVVGVFVYAIAILLLKTATASDIMGMPKGDKIASLLKKLHLLQEG